MRLHVGGKVKAEGWTVLNIQPGPIVDIVGTCTDLSMIGSGTVEDVYASHVLEHLGHAGELRQALAEIFRVLRPGGRLLASVPDLEILCQLFVHPESTPRHRLKLMGFMFGAQEDQHDFHRVGLWWDYFGHCLDAAGFAETRRVKEFGLFEDYSSFTFGGVAISLNVIAVKPLAP
ncbi:MAG: methyltransferase domain-containing protein [Alphaproteobacteria bacterium]|nr:methyltransferase domain-containing protein [Alphaproteobacteria bacterium]